MRIIVSLLSKGYVTDVNTFKAWALTASNDLFNFYKNAGFADYPPVYVYVLSLIGTIAKITGMANSAAMFSLLIRIPAILCDIAIAYIIFRKAFKIKNNYRFALLMSSFFLFNPAVFQNSSAWGQVDSVLSLLVILTLLTLSDSKYPYAAAFFAVSILMKPQAIIISPVIAYVLLYKIIKKQINISQLIYSAIAFITAAFVITYPLSSGRKIWWIYELYKNTAAQYPYASLNAFNLFALLGANFKQDNINLLFMSYNRWGFLFIILTCIFAGFLYYRFYINNKNIKFKNKNEVSIFESRFNGFAFATSALVYIAVFMLSSRMHERYLFIAIPLSLFAYFLLDNIKLFYIYISVSLLSFINCASVLYYVNNKNVHFIPSNDLMLVLCSLAGILALAYACAICFSISSSDILSTKITPLPFINLNSARSKKNSSSISSNLLNLKQSYEKPHIKLKLDKKDAIIMLTMTIIYLLISLPNLGSIKNPSTFWKPSEPGEYITFSFDKKTDIQRINYLAGIGKGEFILEYKDASGNFIKVADIKPNSYTDVFKWNVINVSISTDTFRFTVQKPDAFLYEIGFFEKGSETASEVKQILEFKSSPHSKGMPHYLIDEPHTVPYKSTYLNSTYFDEIYHARTAYEHINKLEPYEWTHPPLGKLFIAAGIMIFGMCGFGWRIIGTLFGAAMVPIMYIFGKKVFNNKFYAFCTAFLMMFDFMHFTQTRIATIDVYVTFFVILMYYYMFDYYIAKQYAANLKKGLIPLFLCGLFFSLGTASKWIALYGAPGLAILFILKKYREYKDAQLLESSPKLSSPWSKHYVKKNLLPTIAWCVLFFIIMPAVIYTLSYLPYKMVPGHEKTGLISEVISYQKQMYGYHKNLKATHPYSSTWWQWPIIYRPVWYYSASEPGEGMASTISALGNPALWWIGALCFFAACYIAFKKKDKSFIPIITAIVSQYLPWIFISRIAYIYHFFSIVPFIILCTVYVIRHLHEHTRRLLSKKYIYAYLCLNAILFIMFYPVLSGLTVPAWYVKYLTWFGSWCFWIF